MSAVTCKEESVTNHLDFTGNGHTVLGDEKLADDFETDLMIQEPKKTLKAAFDYIEVMSLNPEAKRMALATVMMALITIIHGAEMTR
jgi:hypothetical protein